MTRFVKSAQIRIRNTALHALLCISFYPVLCHSVILEGWSVVCLSRRLIRRICMSASLSSVTGWEQVEGRDELHTPLTLNYSLPPYLISFKRFFPHSHTIIQIIVIHQCQSHVMTYLYFKIFSLAYKEQTHKNLGKAKAMKENIQGLGIKQLLQLVLAK
jgi:hypothetical protein